MATQTLDAIPGKLPHCWVMGQRYVVALTGAGAIPWLIPLLPGDEAALRAIYEQLDGVFLTGGVDVDPTNYGEPRHQLCDRTDPARDWTELLLIRWSLADRKPVFGVCRGIQTINVACGGGLYQDIAAQRPEAIKHNYIPTADNYSRDYLAHSVHIEKGSHLAELLGGEQVQVNSMHHQGIKTLAPGLRATAHAPDGLIEGVENPDAGFLIGVQWHPEELAEQHAPHRRLFTAFIEACNECP
jgi:putative glutamine amidotransferase